jgi:DegV family protein with EDD domain
MSVHLHTDDPALFRAVMEEFGTVESFKVDDLLEQQAAGPVAPIALVVDSTCDLSEAAQLRLATVMVPLTINVGGREHLDRVELAPGDFYRLVRESESLPRSSQPNRTDFRRVYEALLQRHDAVVSLHLSSRLSGTYQAAWAAAKDVDEDRVKVVDSRHVSVGMGLVVEATGDAIRAGEGLDRVVAIAEAAAAQTRVFGATPSLESAVKGGRVGARSARVADALRLKPIILFDGDGAVHIAGVHLGFERALRGLARRSVKFAQGGPVRLAVTHADAPAAAEHLLRYLRRHFADDSIPLLESGSVLATHTGLGAVAVAVRRVRD